MWGKDTFSPPLKHLIERIIEPWHEISNNVVCATSKASDQPAQSDQSLCLSLDYSMSGKLLSEHHLELLSLKGGCQGSSETTHVQMSHCWKSHTYTQLPSRAKCRVYGLYQYLVAYFVCANCRDSVASLHLRMLN